MTKLPRHQSSRPPAHGTPIGQTRRGGGGCSAQTRRRRPMPTLDRTMPIPLRIETERLLVRPFVPHTDSESMIAVYCDPEVMRYIPGGALSAESVRATLEEYAQAHEERGFSSWALTG